ncbi:MAG: acyltransferase [Candidatus Thorarchaeota archaeon]
MKRRTLLYGFYMVISIIFSLTVSTLPAVIFFFWFFQNLDPLILSIGWPFVDIHSFFFTQFSGSFPMFVFDHFYFLVLLVPILLISYGFFIGFLIAMLRFTRRGIPYLEDGLYYEETEDWLLYEFHQIYYTFLPHFIWFLAFFLDSKYRHVWFGANIGKRTILGGAQVMTPDRITIGDDCMIGFGSIVTGHVYQDKTLYLKKIKIGNNVTVGGYAIIFAGAEIGDNTIIGANTVVPQDRVVPPNSIWVHGKAIPRKELSGIDPIVIDGMDGDIDLEKIHEDDA